MMERLFVILLGKCFGESLNRNGPEGGEVSVRTVTGMGVES